MVVRRHSWWQKTRKPLVIVGIIAFTVGALALIFAGYWFGWGWTGFNEHIGRQVQQYEPAKTLWDWLQLLGVLAIPAVVGLGIVWVTRKQGQASDAASKQRNETELQIAIDNQHEAALQAYIDRISELLIYDGLRESPEDAEVRRIARARTLTILHGLDMVRKGSVFRFLYESGLLEKDKCVIDLGGANLRETLLLDAYLVEADLRGVDLRGADLRGTDLRKACLRGADLRAANLGRANLSEADLGRADLGGANLREAYLGRAYLGEAYLGEADLSGADLREADLSEADLGRANLRAANLTGASLGRAYLSKANPRGADLIEANLSEAYLGEADLSEASLKGADLRGANLGRADLRRTNLSGACLVGASLLRANLTGAKVTPEQLTTVSSLQEAIMPDGSRQHE
jgi:uncharacterized protein YjbI with pentapeptide repeats